MNISERIKQIRKESKLSQAAFGEKLGVSRDAINNAENSRVVPSELFIQHLCTVFSVNEEWLRNGNGDPYSENLDAEIDKIVSQYGLGASQADVIKSILRLPARQRDAVVTLVQSIVNATTNGIDASDEVNGGDDGETGK